MYRSFARRAIFIALSLIVPVVANWLRAYMIVMIGHLTEMKYAVSIDHLLYGWLFFGIVILILFWIGSSWREDLDLRPAPSMPLRSATRPQSSLAATLAATIAVAAVVTVGPYAADRLETMASKAQPALHAPLSTGKWQPVAGRMAEWDPHFLSPSSYVHQVYGNEASRAGLYIGYYRNQRPDTELISSRNTLVPSDDRVWRNIGQTRRDLVFDGEVLSLTETKLHDASTRRLLVWSWYWVDGQYLLNPYWGKLLQAKSRLFGGGDDGAIVIVYASYDYRPQSAEQVLNEFVDAMLPAITQSLECARRIDRRGS
jgi:EpsI family protein